MSLYYQPVNTSAPGGVGRTLAWGLVAAALVGPAYGFGTAFFPSSFRAVHGFWCFFSAIILAVWLGELVKRHRLAHPALVTRLGAAVGLTALYLSWGVFLGVTPPTPAAGPSFSASRTAGLLVRPDRLWAAVRALNRSGTWAVDRDLTLLPATTGDWQTAPLAGPGPLRGIRPVRVFLWGVWALEVLCLVGGTGLLARRVAREPFSVISQEWATDYNLPHRVAYLPDDSATRAAFEAGRFGLLTPFVAGPDTEWARPYARLTLHSFPHDPSSCYLSVQCTIPARLSSTDKDFSVVEYLAISPAVFQELKARFSGVPLDYNDPV